MKLFFKCIKLIITKVVSKEWTLLHSLNWSWTVIFMFCTERCIQNICSLMKEFLWTCQNWCKICSMMQSRTTLILQTSYRILLAYIHIIIADGHYHYNTRIKIRFLCEAQKLKDVLLELFLLWAVKSFALQMLICHSTPAAPFSPSPPLAPLHQPLY